MKTGDSRVGWAKFWWAMPTRRPIKSISLQKHVEYAMAISAKSIPYMSC
jgi:hypothetical protein